MRVIGTSARGQSEPVVTACPHHVHTGIPRDGTPLTPSPVLAHWRKDGGITAFSFPSGESGWIVTAHELVRQVLADPRFDIALNPVAGVAPAPRDTALDDDAIESLRVGNPMALNGSAHTRIRRMVTRRFTVKAAQARREQIRRIVEDQLDRFLDGPQPADIALGLAEPIANRVHCEILGVPEDLRDRYSALFDGTLPLQSCFDLLREILWERGGELSDGIYDDLRRSDLSRNEIEGLSYIMMVAGRDSVGYMIATSLLALLTHPEQLDALRKDPALMPLAVEEFMRFGTMFITLFPRVATSDVEVAGQPIPAGGKVVASPVAANRDPSSFPDPDDFDIQRPSQAHVGFGFGAHGCVGQQVARIEIAETIEALLRRAPELQLVRASQTEPLPFAHEVGSYRVGTVEVSW